MLDHYRELFRLFRRSIFLSIAVAGLVALGFSLLLLKFVPVYVSSVTMNMQPSEEALRFNREFKDAGQFNPSTIITQTHIERLLSDPVRERALDILMERAKGDRPVDPPDMIDKIKDAVWRSWATLNYGFFIPPDKRTEYLAILKNAISVDFVEGSYIIRLEAKSQYPEVSARIANAFAEAYAEIASADFRGQIFDSVQVVEGKIAVKEAILAELLTEREKLREKLGVRDIGLELSVMLESRRVLVQALQEAEIELVKLENELAYQMRTLGSRQADTEGVLQPQRRKIADQQDEIDVRRRNIAEIDDELNGLALKERELDKLTNAIEAARTDLEALRERSVSLELGTDARMSQLRIVSPAVASVYPEFPKVLVNTVVAMIVGGLLTVAGIILIDTVGTRVRTKGDLQVVIGTRALPTVNRRFRRYFRKGHFTGGRLARRLLRQFTIGLTRRMSAGAGLDTHTVLVTGFLDRNEIDRVAAVIRTVIQIQFGSDGKDSAIKVETIPPVSEVISWDDQPDGTIVVAVPSGKVEEIEVRSIDKVGNRKPRRPFMLIWN